MAFQVSPGVQIKEIDATGVVPAVSTSIGGFSGQFSWGQVEKATLISTENELVEIFGKPEEGKNPEHFLVAASYLKYGNALKVVRAPQANMKNASEDGNGVLIKNEDVYDTSFSGGQGTAGIWAAKCPGALGNSLKVEICTAHASDSNFNGWDATRKDLFVAAPKTSAHAASLGRTVALDELHVAVIDEDGLISGTAGTILETFEFMSQFSDAKKSDGTSSFYKNVINTNSKYIYWMDHHSSLTSAGALTSSIATNAAVAVFSAIEVDSLGGGADGTNATDANVLTGISVFDDANVEEVSLIFAAPMAVANANSFIAKAEARKDCLAFVSPEISDTVGNLTDAEKQANVKGFADDLNSSSYGVCDSTALYVYDRFNDVFRYIGGAGHVAGLCANTDNVQDTWFSPAGFNRGGLRGVTKLAFNPTEAIRDVLYKARVNPIVSIPGQGTVLFGDKTLLTRPSAFDRINVRRLFIALEKSISTAAKAQLFEINDEFTRAQFRNLVEPFLRDVKGRRGITDFQVVCDTSNNTGSVIDSNQFVADIFIKPARSINFITLNFIATRTGVEFSEIAGS